MLRSIRLSAFALLCAFVFGAGVEAATSVTSTSGAGKAAAPAKLSVARGAFGALPDGTAVELFTLTNSSGMEVRISNYGGIITSMKVPDRNGRLHDVVLGYDSLEGYIKNPAYLGAIVGRYANRVGKAQFRLDGKTYHLAANNDGNSLHGGLKGFDKAVWNAQPFEKPRQAGVALTHTSPDGEEGYPGALVLRVAFTLNDMNELSLDYSATTNEPTVLNLTHHDYFNLAGEGSGNVMGHLVTINADRYTPVDAARLPTGELANVAGTPFDFRKPTPIGARINADNAQIKLGAGYDHNFVINRQGGDLATAARVEEPRSGLVLEVRTTQPGVQFYSANYLGFTGKAGHTYNNRDAFCLETEHYPDSPNKPAFPTTTLRPGEEFHSRTVYAFGVK
jgi:aldose 1-epimerase